MLVDPGYGLTIERATDSGYAKMYTFRFTVDYEESPFPRMRKSS